MIIAPEHGAEILRHSRSAGGPPAYFKAVAECVAQSSGGTCSCASVEVRHLAAPLSGLLDCFRFWEIGVLEGGRL